MSGRGRKKKLVTKNQALHQELLERLNFTNNFGGDKSKISVSSYDVSYDDLKNMKRKIDDYTQAKMLRYKASLSDKLYTFINDVNNKLININKLDLINYFLTKTFDEYTISDMVEQVKAVGDSIKMDKNEPTLIVKIDGEYHQNINEIKKFLQLTKNTNNPSSMEILSFIIEEGIKKYLPNKK